MAEIVGIRRCKAELRCRPVADGPRRTETRRDRYYVWLVRGMTGASCQSSPPLRQPLNAGPKDTGLVNRHIGITGPSEVFETLPIASGPIDTTANQPTYADRPTALPPNPQPANQTIVGGKNN